MAIMPQKGVLQGDVNQEIRIFPISFPFLLPNNYSLSPARPELASWRSNGRSRRMGGEGKGEGELELLIFNFDFYISYWVC